MTTNPELDTVLALTGPILLDFDGPVTHLFIDGRNRDVADRIRAVLPAGIDLPGDLRDTDDPLNILRWGRHHLTTPTLTQVEAACVAGEIAAAAAAAPTPGVTELLTALAHAGRAVIVVSNNAREPIHQFLRAHNLDRLVLEIVARIAGRPELMKPDPTPVRSALERLEASATMCAMIGDSVTDIDVCKATGVWAIGYAKNAYRGQELLQAGADALVHDLGEIARHPGLSN